MTYYGWSNKQTWLYSLHYTNLDSLIRSDPKKFCSRSKLIAYLCSELDDLVCVNETNNPFLNECLVDSVSDINWQEIVKGCSFPFLKEEAL